VDGGGDVAPNKMSLGPPQLVKSKLRPGICTHAQSIRSQLVNQPHGTQTQGRLPQVGPGPSNPGRVLQIQKHAEQMLTKLEIVWHAVRVKSVTYLNMLAPCPICQSHIATL
jgi:hypothetical protein